MTESGAGIGLKVKTTNAAYDVSVGANATVLDVKQALLDKVNQPLDKLCLIFSGKILKDADTLAQHSIKDGMAIHLVIRQNPTTTGPRPTPAAAPSTTSAPAADPSATAANPFASMLGSLGGGAGLGAGAAMNPAAMAQQMMSNPEALSSMMNSPLMQSLFSNPQILRSLLTENPQVQQLIESNPELGHILNDPEMMRQTMEMARNPNMFNEMMRNHDQAIRNLQGIPGGEAALQRLYQEVQEPLLNSATSSLAGNPFAALQNNSSNTTSSRSQRAGVENADPLPNPWGGNNSGAGAMTGRSSGGTDEGAAANPAAGIGSMLESPGMQSLMNQMLSDPNVMSSLMSPEAMQGARQMLSSNPQLMESMIRSNPMLASNPQLAAQMQQILPNFLTQVNMPEMMNAMSNPRVVAAMQQIQQGFETLRREAPALAGMFGGMPGGGVFPRAAATGATTTTTAPDGSSATGDGSGAPSGGGSPNEMLAQLMQAMNMAGGGMPQAVPPGNPEEQFASQLEQLQAMGFNNRAENIAALIASFGDVNAAIERLLQR